MKRRKTSEVLVGNVGVGSMHPVRIQSMTTSPTADVTQTIEQIQKLADYGCEIARVTVQGKKEAEACEAIKSGLLKRGLEIPLVADIHFYPPAAMLVADFVDKVRINPGNFVDKRATFKLIEYDDASYQRELDLIEQKFVPLVEKCKRLGKAMRIGTNHGSLSDRIMNRFGDTPLGMVESALEFARVCRKYDYHNFLFSMKASNTLVMIEAYRLLVEKMDELGWEYPLHLGVTEAGNGEDGRIKSAIGTGSLLLDGIGDTIRISLTEDPWFEIDPCKRLIALAASSENPLPPPTEKRRVNYPNDTTLHPNGSVLSIDELPSSCNIVKLHQNKVAEGRAFFKALQNDLPLILMADYSGLSKEDVIIHASAELGSLLTDGIGEGICLIASILTAEEIKQLSFGILQGCRMRLTKTEFIACPGCGRTLFELQEVTERIKEKTAHLPGVKIAIMGCIVNGPGEMADADFGYVGSLPGKIDLYVGKTCVEKNIPFDEADEKLIQLIKDYGKWIEADTKTPVGLESSV